jgi:hypothetical protein
MKGVRSENYFDNSLSISVSSEGFTCGNFVASSIFTVDSPSSIIEKFQTPPNFCLIHSDLNVFLNNKFFFLEHNSPIELKSPYYSNLIENAQLEFNCNHLISKTIHT